VLARLARDNAARNGLAGRVRIVEADVARPLSELGELAGMADGFDHVLANPPYHVEGRGTAAGDARKAAGHAMPEGDLARWVRLMAAMASPGGTATLIHRADALAEVLAAYTGRFGGTLVLPLHPRPDEPAGRVLVQGIKGSRAPLQLLAGLCLHDRANAFQPEVEAMLRHGAGLDLRNRAARP
jgi:tRNA1(Val) A37 N6-methylase TrmN6